jgi:hypothetical protein
MSTDLVADATKGQLTLPVTGEAIDLSKPADVLRAGHALQELWAQIRQAKERVDDAARAHMRERAATVLQEGQWEATQGAGKATFDWQAIYDAALAEGVPRDAAERVAPFERRGDGRELNKLAGRDDAWRKAAAAGTSRSGGGVRYALKEAGAPAPATPASVREQAAAHQAEASRARRLGI